MTNWRQIGWCDVCEWTLDNGGGGDGKICPECGFDSRRAQSERLAEGPETPREEGVPLGPEFDQFFE